jgi:Tol biopolymer transport system component
LHEFAVGAALLAAAGGCELAPLAEFGRPVSRTTLGLPARGIVSDVAISGDGRVVAFTLATADRLDAGAPLPPSNVPQVYLFDVRDGRVRLVSRGADGEPAGEACMDVSLSHDGRRVCFRSTAGNLDPRVQPLSPQAFVADMETGTVRCVSTGVGDVPPMGECLDARIAGNGASVVFSSRAENLLGVDENNIRFDLNRVADVFVRGLAEDGPVRLSVTSEGFQANGPSRDGRISADGSVVAFISEADNLAPADSNGVADVFLHFRASGQTVRVVGVTGLEANAPCEQPALSADGAWVAFVSAADNLARRDETSSPDVFLYEVATGDVRVVNVDESGRQLGEGGARPSISGDGRFVAFEVLRNNRVPGLTANFPDPDVLVFDRAARRARPVVLDDLPPTLLACPSGICPKPLSLRRPAISASGDALAFIVQLDGQTGAAWRVP